MYKVVMRNETETLDISSYDLFECDAAAKAEYLSCSFPAYPFEVWKGNKLVRTWENGKPVKKWRLT